VFGVGNDYDNALARTPGVTQSLVHQFLSPVGDTYWVQMQNSPTPLSGTTVTINDTAPTGDRYNLTVVEVLPAAGGGGGSSFSVSGGVSPASLAIGTSLTLMQGSITIATSTADASGNFSFNSVANGTYTITPSKTNLTFTPVNQIVTVNNANVIAVNFTVQTWKISGNISPVATGSGATISLNGTINATTTADSAGNFVFAGLVNGTYSVTPTKVGYTFSAPTQTVVVNGTDVLNTDFVGTPLPTWSISGTISPPTAGTVLSLSGGTIASTTADGAGNYSFTGLANGTYTITPSNAGFSFSPTSQPVNVAGANVTGTNFNVQAGPVQIGLDGNVSVDSGTAKTTISTNAFTTQSANELLLAFIATDYVSGANTTVKSVTGGGLTWVLVQRTNVQSGSAEIWRAFATSPVSNVTVTATLSQSVVSSLSVLSFTGVDPSGANGSGAIGATGTNNSSRGAPTVSLVTTHSGSWVLGVGNDYDNPIARVPAVGQSLIHQNLTPTGDTYWVQRYDATVPSSGTAVTLNDTSPSSDRYNFASVEIVPASSGVVGPVPPTVSMTAPAPGAIVTSKTTVAATASDQYSTLTGVQFVLDGSNLGSQVTTPPYSITWDSTAVAAGTHTLSAIAYDAAGQSSTSSPITVTVDNSGNPTVVGAWSPVVNLPAVAVNMVLLHNNKVLFYQDGATPNVWDYLNNTFTTVATNADIFCSGHSALADGRILVVGGYGENGNIIGITNAEIFDPIANSWTPVPNMGYRRWYPTATTLSDGKVLVTAGWQTTAHTNAGIPEIFDPSTNLWTKLSNANNPFETYPFIFQLPNGRVIHVGGSEYATNTDLLDLETQIWSMVDGRLIDGGSAVMYLPSQIMKAGSAADSQDVGPSSNTTFVLDMTQATPLWQQTPSMAYPRSFLNLTTLPDGQVLATGGETDKNGGNISNAVYAAELWSPQTKTWTTMASMHTPREYHGTALLLPDGRVLVSGMGADFGQVADQRSAEFYSPPYLFKGPRPTITQAPGQISYGANFTVTTPDAASITSAVLIRTGAVTHFFDENTRFVPLTFQQTQGGLTLTAPSSANAAPPGYYMLFLVNSSGVPSVAPYVQLGP
jgi:hypothetical protein